MPSHLPPVWFCSTGDVPIRVRQYHTRLCFICVFPVVSYVGHLFRCPLEWWLLLNYALLEGGDHLSVLFPHCWYPTPRKYLLNGEGHDSSTPHRCVSGLLPNAQRSVLLSPYYKWWLWGSDTWSNLLLVMWPGQKDLELELGLWCSLWISGVFVFWNHLIFFRGKLEYQVSEAPGQKPDFHKPEWSIREGESDVQPGAMPCFTDLQALWLVSGALMS